MGIQWTHKWNSSKPAKKGRRGRDVNGPELTPDQFQSRDVARVARFQVTGKKYADATVHSIDRVQRFWDRSVLSNSASVTQLTKCSMKSLRLHER